MPAARPAVSVDGRRLVLSNLDKELYPACGFTKRDVVEYYARVATCLCPHLAGRALTMRRFPDGVEHNSFFQKRKPSHTPGWIRTAPPLDSVIVDDPAGLIYVANLASLELHPSLARVEAPDTPTMVVFDLDPGPPATLADCATLALELRGMFGQLGLRCAVKTSGQKGMQVYVPLNTPTTFDHTKRFAHAVAATMARSAPDRVVAVMSREQRAGRVFIDWSQNDPHKTTISVYSLRATPTPSVSTPLAWSEVEQAVADNTTEELSFTASQVLDRVAQHGDLFADVATVKQRLPDV
jgi:bifunctional non-homologous end joining protein LigD